MIFRVNNITWTVIFVSPLYKALIDRTGQRTLATTSPVDRCIYIDEGLKGKMPTRVLKHELGHVMMISYGLIFDLRKLVNGGDLIGIEEFVCNFNADYGEEIESLTREILSP